MKLICGILINYQGFYAILGKGVSVGVSAREKTSIQVLNSCLQAFATHFAVQFFVSADKKYKTSAKIMQKNDVASVPTKDKSKHFSTFHQTA